MPDRSGEAVDLDVLAQADHHQQVMDQVRSDVIEQQDEKQLRHRADQRGVTLGDPEAALLPDSLPQAPSSPNINPMM